MNYKRIGFPVIYRDGEGGGGGGGNQPAEWYKGADAELIGHIQTKGWDKKQPGEVALEAIKAHRQAEKFIGAPADQLLRLPKEPGSEEWKGVWQRLGAPADAKDYDFDGVTLKSEDGKSVLNQGFVDTMRNIAAELHLPKDHASRIATAVAKFNADAKVADNADYTAKLAEEKKALDASWGQNKEAFIFAAKQTANALGVTPEAVTALEKVVGYKAVMDMFLTISKKTGEHKWVESGGPSGGAMTREQAIARKQELMGDKSWADRYLAGDVAANREMTALLTIITGDDTDRSKAR